MTPVQLILTIIASVVGIIALVAAVSRSVVEMVYKPRTEDLAAQVGRAEAKSKELFVEVVSLRQENERRRLSASTAEEKRAAVERTLKYTMSAINATGASIFVPEPSKLSTNFVFLCVLGPVAEKIRKMRFPMDRGMVGSVYSTGKTLNTSNAHKDPHWSSVMDEVSKFKTSSLICVPIILNGLTIGVIQFLNKEAGEQDKDRDKVEQFTATDEETAERFASSIAMNVDDFIHNYENFQRIGITPERDETYAVVCFIDLTASKQMFGFLSSAVCVDRINEYLERQCEIALKHGAVIDKYLGDGAMIRFMNGNVLNALSACVQMNADFEQMKAGWCKFDARMEAVHNRIGMALGPVQEVNIGHPQFKQITVMGPVVNNASVLCECANRSRTIILIDRSAYDATENRVEIKRVVDSDLKHLKEAYEVLDRP